MSLQSLPLSEVILDQMSCLIAHDLVEKVHFYGSSRSTLHVTRWYRGHLSTSVDLSCKCNILWSPPLGAAVTSNFWYCSFGLSTSWRVSWIVGLECQWTEGIPKFLFFKWLPSSGRWKTWDWLGLRPIDLHSSRWWGRSTLGSLCWAGSSMHSSPSTSWSIHSARSLFFNSDISFLPN